MTSATDRHVPVRVRSGHVAFVSDRLSERDWQIVAEVDRLRLVSTRQLDRLVFGELHGRSQVVTRGRVVRRLIAWRVLYALPRRIGGSAHGSSSLILALDSTGRRLLNQRQALGGATAMRTHSVPSERTVRHSLAVSELYTGLVEQCRRDRAVSLASFTTEPAAWWPNGLGNYLKPDAYTMLSGQSHRDHWWCEVDCATESIPALRRKALAYLDFWRRGQLGPDDVMPRVLFSLPSVPRYEAVVRMLAMLPEPASQLFLAALDRDAASVLLSATKG